MAETISSFSGPPEVRYDWANWCDGSIWKLRRGIDWPERYTADDMRIRCFVRAARIGKLVTTQSGRELDPDRCRGCGKLQTLQMLDDGSVLCGECFWTGTEKDLRRYWHFLVVRFYDIEI